MQLEIIKKTKKWLYMGATQIMKQYCYFKDDWMSGESYEYSGDLLAIDKSLEGGEGGS